MTDKTKRAIEKKLDLIEKTANEIRILMEERDEKKIFKTEYGDLLVPRRVSFCEHCMDIKEQIGWAECDPESYEADKNCMANITWCFSCGESASVGPAD